MQNEVMSTLERTEDGGNIDDDSICNRFPRDIEIKPGVRFNGCPWSESCTDNIVPMLEYAKILELLRHCKIRCKSTVKN